MKFLKEENEKNLNLKDLNTEIQLNTSIVEIS